MLTVLITVNSEEFGDGFVVSLSGVMVCCCVKRGYKHILMVII